MLKITKVNNTIKVEGLDNKHFPDNGTLMIPLNSVIILTDESGIATFRSAANNDVLFSGLIENIEIDGSTYTKDTIVTAFSNIANAASGGGGGGSDYDDTEVRNLIAQETSNREQADETLQGAISALAETTGESLEKKQDTLVSGTNIKTVNGESVLGSGNINIKANQTFPTNWRTANTNTMAQLVEDVYKDSTATEGNMYMKTIYNRGLPAGIVNAEVKIEILKSENGVKVVLYTITSSDIEPYHWEMTAVGTEMTEWRHWLTQHQDISNLATKEEIQSVEEKIPTVPTNVSAFTNDAGYITEHQSLDDYYTKTQVDTKVSEATSDMETRTHASETYATKSEIPSLDGYATEQWVENKNYLTQHQDISGKANASDLEAHTGNTEIHVTIADKNAWNAKAETTDIPDVTGYIDDAVYDSETKRINFKHGETVIAYIDATSFVKDGMVSNVEITGGNLVITFNTDAGHEPISIALTDIFNPANYYTKTDIDTALGNKANSSDVYTKTEVDTALSGKQPTGDYATNTALTEGLALKANSADLADVATSGSYTDLEDKPVLFSGDYNDLANKPSLATVATSGSYNDLSDKPVIPTVPTNVSEFTNDAGYTTNEGTIIGITMNGVSKGTSGVVDLGTVITEHQSLEGLATTTQVSSAVSALGEAIEQELEENYQPKLTAGNNITIENNVISATGGGGGGGLDEDTEKALAQSIVTLKEEKADRVMLNNYQLKGDYVTGKTVDDKIAAAVADYRTEEDAVNDEKTTAAAINDLKSISCLGDSKLTHTYGYEKTYLDWLNVATATDEITEEGLVKNATYITGSTVRKAVTTNNDVPYYWFGNDPESSVVTFAEGNVYMTVEFDGTETDFLGNEKSTGHKVEMKFTDFGTNGQTELIGWTLFIDDEQWVGETDGSHAGYPIDENITGTNVMQTQGYVNTSNPASKVQTVFSFGSVSEIAAANNLFEYWFGLVLRTDKVDGSTVLKMGGSNDYMYYKLTLKSVSTGSGMKLKANTKGDVSTDNNPQRMNEYIRYNNNTKAYLLTDKNYDTVTVSRSEFEALVARVAALENN